MKDDKSNLWEGLGYFFLFLGLGLGIGSCSYLTSKGNALETAAHAKAAVSTTTP